MDILRWYTIPFAEIGLNIICYCKKKVKVQLENPEASFTQHSQCMKRFKTSLGACLADLTQLCHKKRLHVSKMLRLPMEAVDEVIYLRNSPWGWDVIVYFIV